MFLNGMDATDQQILTLLIENARMSYSEIGERIGLSRVAVKARVAAMEQRGVIEEYTTIVNPQKISGAISAFFDIEAMPEALPQVVEALRQNDCVTQIYRTTGRCRLHVHAVASSQEEMEELVCRQLDRLPGIVKSDCSIILSRMKDIKGLRL